MTGLYIVEDYDGCIGNSDLEFFYSMKDAIDYVMNDLYTMNLSGKKLDEFYKDNKYSIHIDLYEGKFYWHSDPDFDAKGNVMLKHEKTNRLFTREDVKKYDGIPMTMDDFREFLEEGNAVRPCQQDRFHHFTKIRYGRIGRVPFAKKSAWLKRD